MANGINTIEMGNLPSPDEGPTYSTLTNTGIQNKIMNVLRDAGININIERFEMRHQRGKLSVEMLNSGLKIEFLRNIHYTGRGDKLQFLENGITHIKDMIKKHNDEVKRLRGKTHAALDTVSSEIQSA